MVVSYRQGQEDTLCLSQRAGDGQGIRLAGNRHVEALPPHLLGTKRRIVHDHTFHVVQAIPIYDSVPVIYSDARGVGTIRDDVGCRRDHLRLARVERESQRPNTMDA